ncbi:hypothetical protein HDU77_007787 [Chytriomyces hyalinus]|nr:hypothetical protein HDU77_007787 [Chytriomyces hyalinus]
MSMAGPVVIAPVLAVIKEPMTQDPTPTHLKSMLKPATPLEMDTLELVQATFPIFIRAFSDPSNPLQNANATESEFLNEFIHPLLKESVFRFADGVAKLLKGDFPLAYFEGARLSVLLGNKRKKEYDGAKIRRNCVSILQQTVIEMLRLKKRVPLQLQSFGAQFFDGKLIFTVVDCFVQVPKGFSDLNLFVHLYKAVIGWSMLIKQMVIEFENAQNTNERMSQKSQIGAQAKFCLNPTAQEGDDEDE